MGLANINTESKDGFDALRAAEAGCMEVDELLARIKRNKGQY